MPPETRFLQATYRERERFGDLRDPVNRRALAERITEPATKFADLRLDRSTVVAAVVDGPPTLGSAFSQLWGQFALARGATRWGEKRPGYWRDMDVVLRLFPTAQIIHLVRDPRSVVASLTRVPWWDKSVPRSASTWTLADAELRRVGARLPTGSYCRIRYEDLVRDPRATLGQLCEYLSEQFAAAMLDHVKAAQDIVPGRKSWHERTRSPVDVQRVDAWRRDLDPPVVALIEAVSRRRMRHYGYQPSKPDCLPAPAALAEYHYYRARTRAAIVARRVEDARLRCRFDVPLAAQV